MSNQKKLLITQLDKKLKVFKKAQKVQTPKKGWIHSIRTTINMTLQQLGNRLNISLQGVKNLENREMSGSITLKSLRLVAEALDMQLVYGFVPNASSVDKLIEDKARQLATKIVLRTSHNMRLENQENSEERIKEAIEDFTSQLKREIPKSIWN